MRRNYVNHSIRSLARGDVADRVNSYRLALVVEDIASGELSCPPGLAVIVAERNVGSLSGKTGRRLLGGQLAVGS